MLPEPSRLTEVAKLTLQRVLPHVNLSEAFRRICETSSKTLGVERVGVWLFIDNGASLRCANLYERSTHEHSSGALLHVADFPKYFNSLTIRKAVPSEVALSDSWTKELAASYLLPLKIASMLDAGIFVEDKMVGVLCHEHVGTPREWTTETRDFAGSLADLLALKIQSAQMHELRKAFQTQQERLISQAKSVALENIAAGVAHDFRNLLTIFLGHGELLKERKDVPPDVRQIGEQLVKAAEHGDALSKQLMSLTRSEAKAPVVVDLSTLVSDALPVLKSMLGGIHQVRYTGAPELGQVIIDKTLFTRLLMNLVINARDAMPAGGIIQIRLTPVSIPENDAESGRFVLLEVQDQGEGMSEMVKGKIFEPFFSTKESGNGLGLAIVKQAVERVGGFIQVDSKEKEGTTFRVFFPRIGSSTGGTVVLPALRTARSVAE